MNQKNQWTNTDMKVVFVIGIILSFFLLYSANYFFNKLTENMAEKDEVSMTKCNLKCESFDMDFLRKSWDMEYHCYCWDSFDREVKQIY